MKDSFNSNFYITAATVIPLLYITLFLQSQLIQDLAQRVGRDLQKHSGSFSDIIGRWSNLDFRRDDIEPALRTFWKTYILMPAMFLVLISASAGVVAEALALWALYYQSDKTAMRAIVLWSMLGLLILVCISPTNTIIRNLFPGPPKDGSDKKPPSSEEEQREEGC